MSLNLNGKLRRPRTPASLTCDALDSFYYAILKSVAVAIKDLAEGLRNVLPFLLIRCFCQSTARPIPQNPLQPKHLRLNMKVSPLIPLSQGRLGRPWGGVKGGSGDGDGAPKGFVYFAEKRVPSRLSGLLEIASIQ